MCLYASFLGYDHIGGTLLPKKKGNRRAPSWRICRKPIGADHFLGLVARINFNTYRFGDHKEQVIGLLKRVAPVSLGKQDII